MDKVRHLEISSRGGKARSENYSRKGTVQTQESVSDGVPKLETILGAIEEENELQK